MVTLAFSRACKVAIWAALFAFWTLGSPAGAQAQVKIPSGRFLFIVEASKAIEKRTNGVLLMVQDVIKSEMNHQLRPGDTIGLWTYNADLYSGQFPLQQWSAQNKAAISATLAEFLQKQPHFKQPVFAVVRPALDNVVQNSALLTVLLISSGEPILGTPFDARINEAYRMQRGKQQAANMPFVTVLRGRNGKLTEFTVNQAPWPVDIPPLQPDITKIAESALETNATRSAAAPRPVVSEHKTPPQPGVNVAEPNLAKQSAAAPVATNTPPKLPWSVDLNPVRPNTAAAQPNPRSAPQPGPAAATVGSNAPAPTAMVNVPATNAPMTPPEPPEVVRSPEPRRKIPPARTNVISQPVTARPAPVTNSAPTPVAFVPASPSTVAASKTNLPPQVANAAPSRPLWQRPGVLAAGGVFVICSILAFWLGRRSRAKPADRISLITRSADRE